MRKFIILPKEGEVESEELFVDIPGLYGGWLLTTGGDPVTLNDCEDADDHETIELVNSVLAGKRGNWYADTISEHDIEYVNEWLDIFGIENI